MNQIDIILQFKEAEFQTGNWAKEERFIDFRKEIERGARCTISYAAVELKKYLNMTLKEADICFATQKHEGRYAICLEIEDMASKEDSYQLIPQEQELIIRGAGKAGVLYGVYELLKMQGWRWYEPGVRGEIAPEMRDNLILPEETLFFATENTIVRGFYLEGILKESEELLVWMARNRMNQCAYRKNTAQLSRKLCIEGEEGGHIFETIIDPDRVLPGGETVWEAHPDWYGVPASGEKKKERALRTQFCVTNEELVEFLCDELLSYVMNEWYGAERINVWGFDTWGNVCNCEKCQALGNGTDQNLYFLSKIREYMDKARAEGRLDHDIKLIMCVYEGTCNMNPPLNSIPQNMVDAGDYMVLAPINRCYAHDLEDESCSYNKYYKDCFLGWADQKPKLPIVILEYYNVGRFEDLPLVFINRLKADVPFYAKNGATGFSYMHIPMTAWGLRTLTQILYAELMWNPDMDVDAFIEEYFQNRYGDHSSSMKKAYELQEEAWKYIMSLRSWSAKSILSKLQTWNGRVPEKSLQVDDHFDTQQKFEEIGAASVKLLQEALAITKEVLWAEKTKVDTFGEIGEVKLAVNPVELQKAQMNSKIRQNLEEDKRLMLYGLDTMELMCAVSAYYNALYDEKADRAGELWTRIEELEDKMESYYIPLTYNCREVKMECKDALTRTQLKDTISRCRKYRLMESIKSNRNLTERGENHAERD